MSEDANDVNKTRELLFSPIKRAEYAEVHDLYTIIDALSPEARDKSCPRRHRAVEPIHNVFVCERCGRIAETPFGPFVDMRKGAR